MALEHWTLLSSPLRAQAAPLSPCHLLGLAEHPRGLFYLSVLTPSVMMTADSGRGLARSKGLSTLNCAGHSETSRERTLQKQGEGTEPWTWKEKKEGGEGA